MLAQEVQQDPRCSSSDSRRAAAQRRPYRPRPRPAAGGAGRGAGRGRGTPGATGPRHGRAGAARSTPAGTTPHAVAERRVEVARAPVGGHRHQPVAVHARQVLLVEGVGHPVSHRPQARDLAGGLRHGGARRVRPGRRWRRRSWTVRGAQDTDHRREHDEGVQVHVPGQLVQVPRAVHLRTEHPVEPLRISAVTTPSSRIPAQWTTAPSGCSCGRPAEQGLQRLPVGRVAGRDRDLGAESGELFRDGAVRRTAAPAGQQQLLDAVLVTR